MVLKKILESDPKRSFDKIAKSLSSMDVDMSAYRNMDSDELRKAIRVVTSEAKKIAEKLPYKAYIRDHEYGKRMMVAEALKRKLQTTIVKENAEELIKGFTYYDAKIAGNTVYGKRTSYLGEGRTEDILWVNFVDSARKLKIMEVMSHGSDDDFSTLYFRMADGRPLECANGFIIEHLTESSEAAMTLMEKYCDSAWEGPWPWEIRAPKKIKDIIRENEMRNARIVEMRNRFDSIHRELVEGEIEQSQVILTGRDIILKINKMIHDLGRISAEAMTELKDKVRTEFGEEMAKNMESAANQSVSAAVDSLGNMKKAIEDKLREMEDRIGSDPLDHDLQAIDDRYDDEDGEIEHGGDEGENADDDVPSADVDLGDEDMDDLDDLDLDLDDTDLEPEREKKK